MADPRSDAEVIAESVVDPAMFAVVFDRHAVRIARFLGRRVGRGDAEDLLGEVFRVAFERRRSYLLERPDAAPWLYGIAQNLLWQDQRQRMRQSRLHQRLVEASRSQVAQPDPIEAQMAPDVVAEALGRLPEPERDTLLLRVLEELSYAEIAEALDVPVGTVRSRIARARKRLRSELPDLATITDDEPDRSPR